MANPKKEKLVTDPSLGEQMLGGMEQFRDALARGEKVERRFTVRSVCLDLEPSEYDPQEIASVRDRLGVSQAVFAELLGVSVHTVRSWEHGLREPSKTVRRLMDDIAADPEKWVQRLENAVTTD